MSIRVASPVDALIRVLYDIEQTGNWVGEKREVTNKVVEIQHPTHLNEPEHTAIVNMLDNFHGDDHYHVTTNWTFPTDEVQTNLADEPTPTDETGGYYEKLCDSPKGNQLQSMVDKIDQWGRNNRTCAQVFQVRNDLNAMFPPCLLTLQAMYREGEVNLTAHFRSHTLAKSYYGDITALGRLMEWLSTKVDAGVGSLTVISTSAHIRKKDNEHELAEEMLEFLSSDSFETPDPDTILEENQTAEEL